MAADNNDDEHYDDADGDNANVVIINPNSTLKVAARTGIDSEDERDDAVDDDSAINLIPANSKGQDSQREMIKKAFAGDNVVREFAKEKRRIQEEDDDKTIDETLPGWGHWSGAGLSSKQKKFNAKRRRITKTIEGVKKDKRKDAKLERVIINEKTDKKVRLANIIDGELISNECRGTGCKVPGCEHSSSLREPGPVRQEHEIAAWTRMDDEEHLPGRHGAEGSHQAGTGH